MMRRIVGTVVIAILLGGIVTAITIASRVGPVTETIVSPDRREAIILYAPDRWHRLLGYYGGDYAVARVLSLDGTSTSPTSPPFYLDGAGEFRWSADRVDLGMAGSYDRRRRRWTIY